MPTLDVWYAHMDADDVMAWMRTEVREQAPRQARGQRGGQDLAKARTRDSMRVFSKRTGVVDGELRIVADPPLIVPIEDLIASRDGLGRRLRGLRRAHPLLPADAHATGATPSRSTATSHTARKVVGVGSVGTRSWIHALRGRDDEDPLFLQAKEAQPSVLERFAGTSAYANHGQRVVRGPAAHAGGQRHLPRASCASRARRRDRDYYVRQLHDWKGGVEVETMRVPGATLYGRMCGSTLARAHARSGDRIAIASYLGKGDAFDRAIADFSVAYADQNERDYEAFAKAVKSGRLPPRPGCRRAAATHRLRGWPGTAARRRTAGGATPGPSAPAARLALRRRWSL